MLRLQLHHSIDPSVMRAEHLRMWLRAAMQDKTPDPGNWEKIFAIIQAAFRRGELAALCAW